MSTQQVVKDVVNTKQPYVLRRAFVMACSSKPGPMVERTTDVSVRTMLTMVTVVTVILNAASSLSTASNSINEHDTAGWPRQLDSLVPGSFRYRISLSTPFFSIVVLCSLWTVYVAAVVMSLCRILSDISFIRTAYDKREC